MGVQTLRSILADEKHGFVLLFLFGKRKQVQKSFLYGYIWNVLFGYEQDIALVSNPECNAIGLDYKSDGLFTDSNGNTLGSPKYFRKSQHALTRAQRKLRHKQKGSRNYQKACAKIAKKHRHIANQRKDFLHKLSAEIANQYDMVCVESLNMKAMSNKGFGNGKATLDNGYGMFLSMLEYKLADRGKILIRVDKWYASSQICSCCGEINPAVKDLSIRKWQCPACGCIHDRDINAANNILSEGIREYLDLIGQPYNFMVGQELAEPTTLVKPTVTTDRFSLSANRSDEARSSDFLA